MSSRRNRRQAEAEVISKRRCELLFSWEIASFFIKFLMFFVQQDIKQF